MGKLRGHFWRRSRHTQPGHFNANRARIVEIGLCIGFAVLSIRAFMLGFVTGDNSRLHSMADSQYHQTIELAPYRGNILDRKGEPLAISVRRPSLAINPRVFDPAPADIEKLARILKLKPQQIKKLANKHSYFAWLSRQLDVKTADEAMNLGVTGLVKLMEPARFYPLGSAAGQLLGFVGLDNNGLSGVERLFDKTLRGSPHKVLALRDARGQFILDESSGTLPEKARAPLHLTLDRVIQEIAEDELTKGMHKARARRGFAIVADPHTGKILAIANSPGFDPNRARSESPELTKNHALADVFEPGSVTKPFIIARALDLGLVGKHEVFDCEKGAMRIGKSIIHDDHPADHLTVEETLIRSSNICTYKIAARLGRDKTDKTLRDFGFAGQISPSGFPSLTLGRIAPVERWGATRFANVAFGHGFVINGLELVTAMGVIANGGHLIQPRLVERSLSANGEREAMDNANAPVRVLKPETARELRGMLQKVVTDAHGTAKLAQTKSFSTAGKTGTAQKVDAVLKTYSKDKRIASFVGFAPVEDPHLVIYVMIDEPGQKPYYGGLWAAPVFAGIVDRSLKYLNVAPDLKDNISALSTNAGGSKQEQHERKTEKF